VRLCGFARKFTDIFSATGSRQQGRQHLDVIAEGGVASNAGRQTMAARILP
jgi:hypothetical protein